MHDHLKNMKFSQAALAKKIDHLSVLPVFFNLSNAEILMVGGSEAMAWKLELVVATGAKVHLIAESPPLAVLMIHLLSYEFLV